MAVEDPAGLMPYFSRKAVTIKRQRSGKQAWPCSTTHTSCDTEYQSRKTQTELWCRPSPANQEPPAQVYICVGRTGTRPRWCWSYAEQDLAGACSPIPHSAPHLPLDVLQEVLVALQEAEVLELGVIPLRLYQPALLDVHHLPEAVCTERKGLMGNRSQHSLHLPPSSLLRTFLITLHTSWAASAYPWTCFWAVTTRNPGQGRSLCIPLATYAAACAVKAFPSQAYCSARSWNASSSGIPVSICKPQGLRGRFWNAQTINTFGKKGHVHIWKSALSTSLKSSKVSKLYLRTSLKFTKMLLQSKITKLKLTKELNFSLKNFQHLLEQSCCWSGWKLHLNLL